MSGATKGEATSAGPPQQADDYRLGDQIAGKYQLVRPLGAGGMGVVWIAHNLVLDIHVALKLVRGNLGGPEAQQRLLREARSAARIVHPGVVRIFDFGQTDRGDSFIVMELLEGEVLHDRLEREGRMPAERAVALLLPVAHALGTLKDAGIVHRDLKPENIILCADEHGRIQPKLVDFGVAILPGTRRFTWAGVLVGSADYAAPEQAAGDEVDHRVDVWALSVILYQAITGKLPFPGKTTHQVLNAILTEEPSMAEIGDESLTAILTRGLAKLKSARWSTTREMGAALAAWASGRGVTEDVTGASLRLHLAETAAAGGAAPQAAPSPPQAPSPPPQTPSPPQVAPSYPQAAPVAPVPSSGAFRPVAPAQAHRSRGAGAAMIVIGLVLCAIVLAVVLGLSRRQSSEAMPALSAPATTAAIEPLGPASAAPAPSATATAEPPAASTGSEPAVPAQHPSASAPRAPAPSSTAAAPRPSSTPPVNDLKDPFQK